MKDLQIKPGGIIKFINEANIEDLKPVAPVLTKEGFEEYVRKMLEQPQRIYANKQYIKVWKEFTVEDWPEEHAAICPKPQTEGGLRRFYEDNPELRRLH